MKMFKNDVNDVNEKLKEVYSHVGSEIKGVNDRIEGIDNQIDYLENVIKFLSDQIGYKVYKVKDENTHQDIGSCRIWQTVSYASLTGQYSWDSDPIYEEISIEKLQSIGPYTTFTVGKITYAIAKVNNKSKRGRPKGTKNKAK